MFRTLIGFVLGVITTFYTLPVIESNFGKLSRPEIGKIFSSNENHSSNIINSIPPEKFQTHFDDKRADELMTAISIISARALDEQASVYVLKLITDIVETEPGIQAFVQDRLRDGITNKDALEIFEKYYSLKG